MKRVTTDGEVITENKPFETIPKPGIFFKTPNNHDTDAESLSTALTCTDPSKTQQQFLADADINNILRKFMQGAELPLTGPPTYMDIEDPIDLQDAIVTRYQVDQAWDKLSPEVRNTLKDPQTFSAYVIHCLETGDLEPLQKLGLAKAPPAPQEPPKPATPTGGTPAPVPPAGPPSGPPTAPTGASN